MLYFGLKSWIWFTFTWLQKRRFCVVKKCVFCVNLLLPWYTSIPVRRHHSDLDVTIVLFCGPFWYWPFICRFRYVNKIENNILWQGTKRNWHMYTIRNMKAVSSIQNTIFLSCLLYFSFCLTHRIIDMKKHKKKTSSRVNIIKGKHRP